jgi:hypothetical protein
MVARTVDIFSGFKKPRIEGARTQEVENSEVAGVQELQNGARRQQGSVGILPAPPRSQEW